jgi:DNA-binding beta-propeller fold protein YncE
LLRRLIAVAAWTAAALVLAATAVAAMLIFPATPKPSRSLHFVGFIPLPREQQAGLLSILDYLTVDDRSLFVTSETAGGVYKVPLTSGPLPTVTRVRWLEGAPAAHGVVIDPASGLGFVSRSGSSTVDVFDPSTLTTLKHIAVDDDVDGIFFDPAEKLIYAVNGDPHLAILIDPGSQTKVGTIALGGKPEFAAYDPQTRLIYQNLEDTSAVAVVDVSKRAVVDRWPLAPCSGPTGMALDLARRRMFVVCTNNALMVVVDLTRRRVVASAPVGGGPDSVAYDPRLQRLYVTGKSGLLSVIQQDGPDAYRVLETVHLHYGAHTLAVDPRPGRLYVAYASLLIGPRLAVFEARP